MKLELIDQWIAVQVRSRSELLVETLLQHKGYDTWVPKLPDASAREPARRLKRPLFPGYVFCRLHEQLQGPIITTPGVLRFVGPGGRPEPVAPSEIAAVQTVLSSGLPVVSAEMQPGSLVEVVAGPLRGCRGVVIEDRLCGFLLVGVSVLQRAVSVKLEANWLRPSSSEVSASGLCRPPGSELPRIQALAS